MDRNSLLSVTLCVSSAMLAMNARAQTPGQIPIFDQPGTGYCSSLAGNDCIDSVITQDVNGNIGIGTTTPAARLDVAGGDLNLDDSLPTVGKILKGGIPFIHTFGTDNTFIGKNAGNLSMSGGGNTAGGSFALFSNTTGFNNAAIGDGALANNASGHSNTAAGFQALQANTTGVQNTAIGFQALQSNINGFDNTATGQKALLFNTTGDSNTASGIGTLQFNTTGSRNTAVGRETLQSNTSGDGNTAVGRQALLFNTTGSLNTAIGHSAGVSTGNLTNATAIGAGALVNASNKVRIGNDQVTVIAGHVGFTVDSDRNQKENFRPVDGEQVLGKIRGLSLTSWNFIGHDSKRFRHYGPMAQDFFAAFGHDGVGTIGTDTTITSTDMDGIVMIAAQALERRTMEQNREIASLRNEAAAMKADAEAIKGENAHLKARLDALERSIANAAFTRAE